MSQTRHPIRFAGELYKIQHQHLVSLDRQTTVVLKIPTAMFEEQMSALTSMMGTSVDVSIEEQ